MNRLPLPVSRNFGQPHNVITPLLHAVLNIYECAVKIILTAAAATAAAEADTSAAAAGGVLPQGAEVVTGVAATGAVAEAAPGEHYRCSFFLSYCAIFILIYHVTYINRHTQKLSPPRVDHYGKFVYMKMFFMRLFRILKIS